MLCQVALCPPLSSSSHQLHQAARGLPFDHAARQLVPRLNAFLLGAQVRVRTYFNGLCDACSNRRSEIFASTRLGRRGRWRGVGIFQFSGRVRGGHQGWRREEFRRVSKREICAAESLVLRKLSSLCYCRGCVDGWRDQFQRVKGKQLLFGHDFVHGQAKSQLQGLSVL